MKTFLLSIVIVFTCSVWAVGQNNRKLLPELLKEGSIDTYGLEKSFRRQDVALDGNPARGERDFFFGRNGLGLLPFCTFSL